MLARNRLLLTSSELGSGTQASGEICSPGRHLEFRLVSEDPELRASGPGKREIINLCCFKLLICGHLLHSNKKWMWVVYCAVLWGFSSLKNPPWSWFQSVFFLALLMNSYLFDIWWVEFFSLKKVRFPESKFSSSSTDNWRELSARWRESNLAKLMSQSFYFYWLEDHINEDP